MAILVALHALALSGCVRYRPQPVEDAAFWERVQVRERAGLRVSAAALGPAESREMFGVDLARHGIQPVWLQIENIVTVDEGEGNKYRRLAFGRR